ncbi:transporter [Pelagibius sp.]|uniref:transporter n=1 Tax=Pelagibius sp. TaxID=1931238 RepID=UPI0026373162|nr:transporter [Pelagibius sp.]
MFPTVFTGARNAVAFAALVLSLGLAGPLAAEENGDGFLGLDLKGSLGEGRHSRYVPPLTNPIFNETPYITTEARAVYFYHRLPEDFVTDGGDVNLVALQLRLAITERLGFIATKDGYVDFDFDETLPDTDGFANIALGFKYAIISDPVNEGILTAGLRYEIPIHDLDTGGIELQGNGDGFLNPFVTAARAFGDFGLQASFGANFALDPDEDTSILHYSVHADYEVLPGLFPIVELNGFTAFNNADRLTGALGDLDGVDVLNFGSEDRDTTVTIGGGARYRLNDHFQFGLGAETPITDKDDTIFDYRVYFDLVAHF